MSETETLTAARTPTVYFIDDSATMREVIKIAFRKENIHVVTCPDARSALEQFHQAAPDAVITDVIMPDQDGYQVCEFIKQHEQFSQTPVILMSGVVNKSVAERAMAVRADELVRKPFQPQELIARVKNLLNPRRSAAGSIPDSVSASTPRPSQALTSLFAPPAAPRTPVAAATAPRPSSPTGAVMKGSGAATSSSAEVQKLRTEVLRLELLVKKLEASLDAEKEYCAALEAHLKALQHS
jgi:DNA-binding response OmpR family regulator